MSQLPPPIPNVPPQQPGPMLQPHRGSVILVLGILGIVLCFICGIFAWVMGNRDLRAIDAGLMDPAGRGMTNAGKICGMVGTILASVAILMYCGIAMLGFLGIMAGAAASGARP